MIDRVKTQQMAWMALAVALWVLTVLGPAEARRPAAAPDIEGLLARADAMRVPFREGRVRVELFTLEGERVTGRSAFEVLQSACGASRVEMLDARVRGQRALLSDHGLWLYVPSSRRAIRLTPLQRLMGNANYGDIGRMRWTDDYRIARAEPAEDRPGAWLFRLEACAPTAVYSEVALWVEDGTARPLRAEFYLASGKLLKSAEYAPPVILNGREVIDTVTFTGGLSGGTNTRMVMGAFREETLPEHLFTLGGLSQ